MNEFEVGKVYKFAAIDVYDINGVPYIRLTDGIRDTYRTKAFDFQSEWEPFKLPKEILCFVQKVDIFGNPTLLQHKKSLLEEILKIFGDTLTFIVEDVLTDIKSDMTFYLLKDPGGVRHRYYLQKNEEVLEKFSELSLKISGITEKQDGKNNAFFTFEKPDNKPHFIVPKVFATIESEEDNNSENQILIIPEIEGQNIEFKTSIVFVPGEGGIPNVDKQMTFILKTISGFMNAGGGTLYIGVNDKSEIVGIHHDLKHLNSENDYYTYSENIDGYQLKIRNEIRKRLGDLANSLVQIYFKGETQNYCEVVVKPADVCILMDGNKLFQRAGNMTQKLTNEAMIHFILNRYLKRIESNTPQTTLPNYALVDEELDDEPLKTPEVSEINPTTTKKNLYKIWNYMTFYNNGDWSYGKSPRNDTDVRMNIAIRDSQKRDRLFMVYETGKINCVIPYDCIKPLRKDGKRATQKNINQRYANGWNSEAVLIGMCVGSKSDFIGIEAISNTGVQYLKIHNVDAIGVHTSMSTQGNSVLPNTPGLSLSGFKLVNIENRHLISELVFKNHHKTTQIGIDMNNHIYLKYVRNYQSLPIQETSM